MYKSSSVSFTVSVTSFFLIPTTRSTSWPFSSLAPCSRFVPRIISIHSSLSVTSRTILVSKFKLFSCFNLSNSSKPSPRETWQLLKFIGNSAEAVAEHAMSIKKINIDNFDFTF